MFKVYFNEYKRFVKQRPMTKLDILKILSKDKDMRTFFLCFFIFIITYICYWFYYTLWMSIVIIIECISFAVIIRKMDIENGFETDLNAAKYNLDRDLKFLEKYQLLDKRHIEWLIQKGKEILDSPTGWEKFLNLIKSAFGTFIIPVISIIIPYFVNISNLPDTIVIIVFISIVASMIVMYCLNIAALFRMILSTKEKLRLFIDNLEYIQLDLDSYINTYNKMKKE